MLRFASREAMTHPVVRAPGDDLSAGSSVPVVVFDKVSLAFDDTIVLREVSFSVRAARLTMLLGRAGRGSQSF